MTYKFLWDAKTGYASNTANDVRTTQEIFVRLVKFFDNASALGVTRIASNYGASSFSYSNASPAITLNGTGFGYWDEAQAASRDAWALYRWGNAQVVFYVLIQWGIITSGATGGFGIGPGYPASHPDTASFGVGIQIACRADGTSPWGGTTRNDGTDTKTNPVWTAGNSLLYVWPRVNSPGGNLYNGSRGAMQAISYGNLTDGGTPWRSLFSAVIDENNIFINNNYRGSGNCDFFYFGRYIPASGTNPPVPYWSITDANDPPYSPGTVYGSTTPLTGTASRDGGIGIPNPTLSGTVSALSYDVPDGGIFPAGFWWHPEMPNTGSNNPSLTGSTFGAGNAGVGILVERPVLLFSSEAGNTVGAYVNGLVGYSYDFLRLCSSYVPPMVTLSGSTRLCIGTNIGAGGRWTVPWTGSLGPVFSINTRNGVEI